MEERPDFDAACAHCGKSRCARHWGMAATRAARDWRVTGMTDRGPGHFYRYEVRGENLNWLPWAADRHFIWSVPCINNERYDFAPLGGDPPVCACVDCARLARTG